MKTKIKNKLLITAAVVLLSSCSGSKMTVMRNDLNVDTYCPEKTEVMTLLKKRNGTVLKKCGYWGVLGDQIKTKKGLIFENHENPNQAVDSEKKKADKKIINNRGNVIDDYSNVLKNIE